MENQLKNIENKENIQNAKNIENKENMENTENIENKENKENEKNKSNIENTEIFSFYYYLSNYLFTKIKSQINMKIIINVNNFFSL